MCALKPVLDMLVDSGEVLRVENLLSDNSINGAGDKLPRGTVLLFPISARVGVLLSDNEVVAGELGVFHLLGSSTSITMLVVTPWVGTVVVIVPLATGAGDKDKLLSQLLLAETGSRNERTATICEARGWLTETLPEIK